jgi:hypothetical protein
VERKRRARGEPDAPALLILDRFTGQTKKEDKNSEESNLEKRLGSKKIFVRWIPGGYTGMLQPLDQEPNHNLSLCECF